MRKKIAEDGLNRSTLDAYVKAMFESGLRVPYRSSYNALVNVEQLQTFCLSFPGATEDIKWGADLCFCVGEKMFCVTGADSIAGGLSLKCTPEKFAELTEREGIDAAAYVGRYKWVRISDLNSITTEELKELISTSYQLVRSKLPKGVRDKLK